MISLNLFDVLILCECFLFCLIIYLVCAHLYARFFDRLFCKKREECYNLECIYKHSCDKCVFNSKNARE